MTSVNEAILTEIYVHGELKSRAAMVNQLVDNYYIKRQLFWLLMKILKSDSCFLNVIFFPCLFPKLNI